jgi:cytochrome P450
LIADSLSQALVRPNFTKSQVADLDTFERHISNLFKLIPHDGSTVDLQPLFFRLTLDSATEFLFGQSVQSLVENSDSDTQSFGAAFDYAQSQLGRRARMGKLRFLYRNAKFDEACRTAHDFADKFVFKALEYRRKHPKGEEEKEKYVFLNELAKSTDDAWQLRDEVLNILVAGRDTTASLLSLVFHVLARRKDVWDRLMNEVESLDGARPDYETLRNMRYLKWVLNEST